PGPKSVSPAMNCSGVEMVVCLKWIVDISAPSKWIFTLGRTADLRHVRPGRLTLVTGSFPRLAPGSRAPTHPASGIDYSCADCSLHFSISYFESFHTPTQISLLETDGQA